MTRTPTDQNSCLTKAGFELEEPERLWAYCGQDCAVTAGVANRLQEMLQEPHSRPARAIYEFERACLATASIMALRGVLVDYGAVSDELRLIKQDCRRLQAGMPDILKASAQRGIGNAPSPADISKYFYQIKKLPPFRNRSGQVSTDRECLQRIAGKYEEFAPLVQDILQVRELDKDRQTLERGIDSDGRLRGGWSVGATETGRWSCSENPMGGGGNLQNIRHRLRKIFVPDPGYVMVYADLAQAESRTVAYLSGDDAYIESHLQGDTHLNVCNLLWPGLPWTGDSKEDRKIADQPADFGPNHSWRDWAKREQHAFNYMQSYVGAARTLRIQQVTAKQHQRAYFSAFPGIPAWHNWVKEEVSSFEVLTSPLGRQRQFLGRTWEASTHREAVSFVPQSVVGDLINLSGIRLFDQMEPDRLQLLANGHDAWLFQVREDEAMGLAEEAVRIMQIPIEITDCRGKTRTMTIPADYDIGGNWAEIS